MKYLTLITFILLTACSPKPANRQLVCLTPFTPLGGVQINTPDPSVSRTPNGYRLTTPNGTQIIIPDSLCVEVINAENN